MGEGEVVVFTPVHQLLKPQRTSPPLGARLEKSHVRPLDEKRGAAGG